MTGNNSSVASQGIKLNHFVDIKLLGFIILQIAICQRPKGIPRLYLNAGVILVVSSLGLLSFRSLQEAAENDCQCNRQTKSENQNRRKPSPIVHVRLPKHTFQTHFPNSCSLYLHHSTQTFVCQYICSKNVRFFVRVSGAGDLALRGQLLNTIHGHGIVFFHPLYQRFNIRSVFLAVPQKLCHFMGRLIKLRQGQVLADSF